MNEWVTQVHIPRTGGTALREAMRGYRFWRMASHPVTLEAVTTALATVTVRDPVARFISCCGWGRDVLAATGYRDAEALALDLRGIDRLDTTYQQWFAPQVNWLISADYVRERCFWYGWTDTLDTDVARLAALLETETPMLPARGEKRRNASPVRYELSPLAEDNVRDWYALDGDVLEELSA